MSVRSSLATLVLVTVLLVPAVSKASAVDDLKAQIAALLTQITQLQARLAGLQGVPASITPADTSSNQFTVANDTTNPLKVTFSYVMNQQRSCKGGVYGIYFGDEAATAKPYKLSFPAKSCNAYVQYTEHTYARAGVYTGRLYDQSGTQMVSLGTVQVSVGSGAAVAPSCSLTASPSSATVGNRVNVSWTSTNAKTLEWVKDTSGKDNLVPPAGKPGLQGSASVLMTVSGNPFLTLRVLGTNGSVTTCQVVIPVSPLGSPVTPPVTPPPTAYYEGSYSSDTPDPGYVDPTLPARLSVSFNSGPYDSKNPVLKGTATADGSFTVVVSNSSGNTVFTSGYGYASSYNGAWQLPITSVNLANGTYSAKAIAIGGTNKVIGTGTFTVNAALAPANPTLGVYRGYLNGSLFISTSNITRDYGLENCMRNHNNNPGSAIRCTWNDAEIYSFTPVHDPQYDHAGEMGEGGVGAMAPVTASLAAAYAAIADVLKQLLSSL